MSAERKPKCEWMKNDGTPCSRSASMTMWCPTAPSASENATMRMCAQHANAQSLRGWRDWDEMMRRNERA